MTIKSDAVRRTTLSNGRPAPSVYENPVTFDIVIWIPIMYMGEILGSFMLAGFLVWSMNSTRPFFGNYDED